MKTKSDKQTAKQAEEKSTPKITGQLEYTVKTKFTERGEEHVFYCQACGSELRAGKYRLLFCPRCRTSEDPNTLIDWVMSCCHCDEPATIKLTSDGRRVCRCGNEKCGDLWSMQDLTGIALDEPIGNH